MNGRVLVLLGDTFHAPGGIAQYNRDLIAAWEKLAFFKEIILLPRFASSLEGELPAKVVQEKPVHRLFNYVAHAIVSAIHRSPFDFIFCAHLNFVPLALVLSRMLGVPVWLQLHGIEAWGKPSRLVRWSAEKSTLITSVSRHTRRMFLEWANLAPEIVRVLPNTFGAQFHPDVEECFLRDKFGLDGERILLTVSRLSRQDAYKGHDKIIKCMPKLCAEFPNLVYAIAGDGDLRPELHALAESLQVQHAVKFLGEIKQEAMPSLYREADVFVMPSTEEGFGIVYLESIACGTPVIAAQDCGADDPLQDGALGVLSTEGELLEAIRRQLRSTGSRTSIGRCDLQRASSVVRFFGRSVFQSNVAALTTRLRSIGRP